MQLTESEKAMLDGRAGKARQKAMERGAAMKTIVLRGRKVVGG